MSAIPALSTMPPFVAKTAGCTAMGTSEPSASVRPMLMAKARLMPRIEMLWPKVMAPIPQPTPKRKTTAIVPVPAFAYTARRGPTVMNAMIHGVTTSAAADQTSHTFSHAHPAVLFMGRLKLPMRRPAAIASRNPVP